jgi:hypothetical protein
MTMNFGVMWRCNGKPLDAEIREAVAHVERKYGMTPERCLMSDKDQAEVVVPGIAVEKSTFIQAGHLWLGGK